MLRKRLHIPTFHVSLKAKSYLRPLKWIILVYFLASVLFFGMRPVMYIRPDLSFSSADMSIYKIIIVGVVTGICFLKERAFCKYCPLGTLRGFVNKISFGKIKKDSTACTHCRACLECCPMLTSTLLFCCLQLYRAAGLRRLFFISGFQQSRNGGQALWQSIRKRQITRRCIPV